MLYSIGKDSSVMLRLAQKAFYPGKIPFPLLHIDTSYKFPEMIEFRDRYTKEIGAELVSGAVLTAWPSRPVMSGSFHRRSRWLAWLAVPLGVEAGFSSAGAGALGSLLLFNFTPLSPAQVVGTDMVFGTALTSVGAVFHFSFGTVSGSTLQALLDGGLPGVLIGCLLAPRLRAHLLRKMVLALTMLLGVQLLLMGTRW